MDVEKICSSAMKKAKSNSFSVFSGLTFKSTSYSVHFIAMCLLLLYQPRVLSSFLMFADMVNIKQHFNLSCISLITTGI